MQDSYYKRKGKVILMPDYVPCHEDVWGSGGYLQVLTSALEGSE